MASFIGSINLWNIGMRNNSRQEDQQNDNYSVAKLRSLYTTLLSAITIPEEETLSLSLGYEESLTSASTSGIESNVRNFRADVSSQTVLNESFEDGEDEISFELFAHASKSYSDFDWKRLAATNVPPEEEFQGVESSTLNSNDADVAKLIHARKLEARVVELIRSIGETVVYGEQRSSALESQNKISSEKRHNNEAVFEYFCDKNMLSLLVDIINAKPMHSSAKTKTERPYSGIIWTALVKAQVLQTISILITNVSDPKSLYYLLSNNYINEVVASMVPLQQWTKKALDEILPVYVSFLKTLAMQLTKSPDFFLFFCDQNGGTSSLPPFPLFYAAIEVISSPLNLAQSDPFIRTVALNTILDICQIQLENIRVIVGESLMEQRMLFSHFCGQIVGHYECIANLMVGNRFDYKRNKLLVNEVKKLKVDLKFINDILWCSHRAMNFRFCEYIMQYAIYHPILEHMLELMDSFKGEGIRKDTSSHLCNEEEAKSESAIFLLLQIYNTIDYTPLLKMITVALIHPYAPTKDLFDEESEFILTPALNAIVQNEYVVVSDDADNSDLNVTNALMEDESTTHVVSTPDKYSAEDLERSVAVVRNKFREAIFFMLEGRGGNGSFTLASLMVENILKSKAVDDAMLKLLHLFPCYTDNNSVSLMEPPIETELCAYFGTLRDQSKSIIDANAFGCGISLMLCYTMKNLQVITDNGADLHNIEERIFESDLFANVKRAMLWSAAECKKWKQIDGVSEIFPDLTITEIRRTLSCDLAALSTLAKENFCSIMIQTSIPSKCSETEDARFALRIFFLFKALDDVLTDMRLRVSTHDSSRWSSSLPSLYTTARAPKDVIAIGSLDKQSIVGTDVDVGDRTTFYFAPSLEFTEEDRSVTYTFDATEKGKRRFLADKILVNGCSNTELILAVDDTEILVLKPKSKDDMGKGTILCCMLLNNIIAIAADGEWLHIAIRNVEDVGVLIQKGNMALRFDTVEICNTARNCVHENLEKSKESISLMIDDMFECNIQESYTI